MLKALQSVIRRLEADDITHDLTIVFSGHNILEYLKLSIGSLLLFHPELRQNIVIFDDDSTDGTVGWAKENGFTRMTWSPRYREHVRRHYEGSDMSASYRVSCLISDMIEQTSTRYLFVSDGDVIFLRRFLCEYQALAHAGYKAILPLTTHCAHIFEKPEYAYFKEKFSGYEILLGDTYEGFLRSTQYHMLLDIQYLKEQGIIYDRVFDKDFEMMQTETMENLQKADTGLDFYYQIVYNRIEHYNLAFPPIVFDPIYHIGWRSSLQRRRSIEPTVASRPDVHHILTENLSHIRSNVRLRDIIETVYPEIIEVIKEESR